MLLKVLGSVVDNLLVSSGVGSANVGLNYVDVIEDVSAVDKPKRLEKPSTAFITGSVDVSSVTIKVVGNEVALASGVVSGFNILAYPEVSTSSLEIPFVGVLIGDEVPGVTNRYVMLKIKYIEDPYLPTDALVHDVRINMESSMIEKAVRQLPPNSLLVIDGPIYYSANQPGLKCLWNEELDRLNERRVSMLRYVYERGNLLPINVVKRVRNSYYITSAFSRSLTDLEYLGRLIKELGFGFKPFRTSIYECSLSVGPKRYFTYVVIPRSTAYNYYSVFRIELLKSIYDDIPYELVESIVSYIAYEAWGYGLSIPYKLYIADIYSKKLVRNTANILTKFLISKGFLIPYEVLENE